MKKDTKNREIFVAFADDDTKNAYDKLANGKFEDKELHKFITRAISDLKIDPFVGTQIPKQVWPKEYIVKFEIKNLWKYDLPNGWRVVYTIRGSELDILSILIEWYDHKNYERRFKY